MGARGPKPGYRTAQTAEEPESRQETMTPKTITEQPNTTVLTPEQQAIAARVASQTQDDGWLHLRGDEILDFSLTQNQFDLPREVKRLQDEKRYAFRWCERKPERVDQLTRGQSPPMRWGVVNSVQLPELAHLVDPITGGVCNGGMILLFKPWSHHEMYQAAKRKRDEGALAARSLEGAASRLSGDGIEVKAGQEHKISGKDVVMQAEDASDLNAPAETVDDLVAP